MATSLMVVVLLVLFLFIPACIALFMSGRSLLLIFLGAVACRRLLPLRLQGCLPGAGLSRWGWGRHHSFSTLSGCTRLKV